MNDEPEIRPTWGFAKDGSRQIFNLGPNEKLPAGWEDSPAKFEGDDEDASQPRGRKSKGA